MGLLANISEVASLRPTLMANNIIDHLKECLDNHAVNCGWDGGSPIELLSSISSHAVLLALIFDAQQDLEINYNATGILCHLIAEGPELWRRHGLYDQLSEMLGRLVTTVSDQVFCCAVVRVLSLNFHCLSIPLQVDSWTNTPESWINYRSVTVTCNCSAPDPVFSFFVTSLRLCSFPGR